MNIRDFLIYGLAAGLNRAGVFLLLPFAAFFMSPEGFGQLSLYLVSTALLTTMVSFNISVIVSREVYQDAEGVREYLAKFNLFLFLFFIIFFILSPFFYKHHVFWFSFLVMSESFFLINSTYTRYMSGPLSYLIVTVLKFLFLTVFSYVVINIFELKEDDLLISLLVIMAASNLSVFFVSFKSHINRFFDSFYSLFHFRNLNYGYFLFAISLMPHSIALWLSSSFDRFFVKWFFNEIEFGVYSFSYSLASLLLLFSSSLALGLPQLCVLKYKLVASDKFYYLFFIFTSFLHFLFFIFLYIAVPYFDAYPYDQVMSYSLIVSLGIYHLFYYLYFSSALFYERKGKLISWVTFFICIFSISALYPFSLLWGIMGVSLVTYFAYLFYMLLVGYYSVFGSVSRLLMPIMYSLLFILFYFT